MKNITVSVDEDLLIINGIIVPYAQQVMRSKDVLFITDIGIEVPIDKQLRDFDQYYFHFLLKEQIVSQLESNHISIGLQILKELPYLQPEHYAYIFRKLSINKISQIIMNNDFFLFIWLRITQFIRQRQQNSLEQIRKFTINYLDQPYKRIIHLLIILEQQVGQLKYSIQSLANQLIFLSLDRPLFLSNLAYIISPQSQYLFNQLHIKGNFLKNLFDLTISLQYLYKIPNQLIQQSNFSKNFLLKSYVLNNQCFKIIGLNFKQFYINDPQNLILILSVLVTQDSKQFWKQIIACQANKNMAKQNEEQVIMDNINLFRQLILNNYFSNKDHIWDQSIHILDYLSTRESLADQMLIDILQDLVRFHIKIEVIDLITSFIHKKYKHKQISQFKLFISSFLYSIGIKVTQQYNSFMSQSKKKIKSKYKCLENLLQIPKFPKINTKVICAYLRVFLLVVELNLFQEIGSLNLQKRLEELLIITRDRYGLIEGARRTLIRAIKANLINEEVKNSKRNCGTTESLPKNPRKDILNKIISDNL